VRVVHIQSHVNSRNDAPNFPPFPHSIERQFTQFLSFPKDATHAEDHRSIDFLKIIKKAKENYQKKKMTPAELMPKGKTPDPKPSKLLDAFGPKSKIEKNIGVVQSRLLHIKSLKFPTGTEGADGESGSKEEKFAKEKPALLTGLKLYYQSLVKNKASDPNKDHLPKYLKVLTLITVSVKGLTFELMTRDEAENPDVENIEEPSPEDLRLMEGDGTEVPTENSVDTPIVVEGPKVETPVDPVKQLRKEFAGLGTPPPALASLHKTVLGSVMFLTSADAIQPELDKYKQALQDYNA
jgi:hypothetical protein